MGTPVFSIMSNPTAGYEDVKAWVEETLGEELPDDLWEWAHDGKRLCKLANILKPGTVDMGMLNKRSGPMFFMQNIDFATEGFKKLLPKKYGSRIFRSPDLYEKGSSYPRQIWICLDALKSEDEKGKYGSSHSAPRAAASTPAARPLPPQLAKDLDKTKKAYAKSGVSAAPRSSNATHGSTSKSIAAPAVHAQTARAGGENTTGEYAGVKAWVERKLGESLSDDLWEWSHDGKRLCKLANVLVPGSVDMKMLNKRSGPFFHMQNIDFATEGFKKMLPRKYQARLFRSPDLYERSSSYPKSMWICLDALMNLDEDGKLLVPK